MSEPQNPNPDSSEPKLELPAGRPVDKKPESPSARDEAVTTAGTPALPGETGATAAKPAPPAATLPKPAAKPAAKPAKKGEDRRFFLLTWMGVAWTTFSLSMVGMTLGTVRFLFPNVLSEPPTSFKAGPISGYEENVVTDRFKEQNAWVVRARDEQGRDTIYALSTTCTHLGCTPNWLEAEKKFKCPCHGSGFKMSGVNFEGPAPRPLERWAVSRTEDGQVLVDKSRKFQRERGEWDDPSSYIIL